MIVTPAAQGSVGSVRTEYVDLPHPLALDCGQTIYPVHVAYEMYGEISPGRDNVVLICHALSGDAHAAGWSAEAPSAVDGIGAQECGILPYGGLGWWDVLIGPGKAFDTDKYCVICTNVLGGCRGTTSPASIDPQTGLPYGLAFPVITVRDMVRAQAAFLDVLGIDTLLCASGGSLGGMQALQWTVSFPDRIRSCVTTASAARLNCRGVAWEAIARNAIMADPQWQGGYYYGTGKQPNAGLGVGRMVGHVTYLSEEALEQKFGRRLRGREHYSFALDETDFEVESYLSHQAETFSNRFDANSYLYISRALTYFDLGKGSPDSILADALEPSRASYLLISFSSDWLYPTEDSLELLDALRDAGKPAHHHEIQASYGHDSFLLERDEQTELISDFLASVDESC